MQLCAHHLENLLYLCDTGIFHSVWVAVWSAAVQQTRQLASFEIDYAGMHGQQNKTKKCLPY
jgi:hypothetical protein